MPTSPRDLAGGTGWYQPTALFSNLRADEGHRPLREGLDFSFNRARPDVLGVPSTPAAAAAPSESTEGRGVPPQESTEGPSSVRACGPATFQATSGGGFIRQTLGEGWRLC